MTGRTEKRYTSPTIRQDVTEEMVTMAEEIVSGWYDEGRIDWEDVWDRMEKYPLEDGSRLDMGTDLGSPALRYIQSQVRTRRAADGG